MLKLELKNNRIHFGRRFSVSFQRTLRIPDDGRVYPLPPGLGLFPVSSVVPHAERVPANWGKEDFFISVYQREALWLGFDGADWRPNAVKVGIGKINVVSGKHWDIQLNEQRQDYLVCPLQPWVDGINAGENFVRQFVSMPLGEGYTVEAQVTGEESFGGIQLLVYEPKPGKFPNQPPRERTSGVAASSAAPMQAIGEMGLGAGGKMKQKIYPDPFGIETWDQTNYGSAFVHLVNSEQYRELTGVDPPPTPISAQTYSEYGLPWFDLYDESMGDVAPPEVLSGLGSIKTIDQEKNKVYPDDPSIEIDDSQIKKLS